MLRVTDWPTNRFLSSRWRRNKDELRSALQKLLFRRGLFEYGAAAAVELDISRNGNAVFDRAALVVLEDMSTEPFLLPFVHEMHRKWLLAVKRHTGSSATGMSYAVHDARLVLLSMLYTCCDHARKRSRVLATSLSLTYKYVKPTIVSEVTVDEIFSAMQRRMTTRRAERSVPLPRGIDDREALYFELLLLFNLLHMGFTNEWKGFESPAVWGRLWALCLRYVPDARERLIVEAAKEYYKNSWVRFFPAAVLRLIVFGSDKQVVRALVPPADAERMYDDSYQWGLPAALDSVVVDKHTQKGRVTGADIPKFFNEGVNVINGVPDPYEAESQEFYLHKYHELYEDGLRRGLEDQAAHRHAVAHARSKFFAQEWKDPSTLGGGAYVIVDELQPPPKRAAPEAPPMPSTAVIAAAAAAAAVAAVATAAEEIIDLTTPVNDDTDDDDEPPARAMSPVERVIARSKELSDAKVEPGKPNLQVAALEHTLPYTPAALIENGVVLQRVTSMHKMFTWRLDEQVWKGPYVESSPSHMQRLRLVLDRTSSLRSLGVPVLQFEVRRFEMPKGASRYLVCGFVPGASDMNPTSVASVTEPFGLYLLSIALLAGYAHVSNIGDRNWRNVLVTPNVTYIIDLEETRHSYPPLDTPELSAMVFGTRSGTAAARLWEERVHRSPYTRALLLDWRNGMSNKPEHIDIRRLDAALRLLHVLPDTPDTLSRRMCKLSVH